MDAFVKNLERLADMARREPDPRPLDAAGVMARLRGIDMDDADDGDSPPLTLFAGGAMAAAAAALFAFFTAQSAWQELVSPLNVMGSFTELADLVR